MWKMYQATTIVNFKGKTREIFWLLQVVREARGKAMKEDGFIID